TAAPEVGKRLLRLRTRATTRSRSGETRTASSARTLRAAARMIQATAPAAPTGPVERRRGVVHLRPGDVGLSTATDLSAAVAAAQPSSLRRRISSANQGDA